MTELTRSKSAGAWDLHAQAVDRSRALTDDIQSWRAAWAATRRSEALLVPAPRGTPSLALPDAAPAHWDALLSDALCHLRGALDALAASCADLDALTPAQRQRVGFPVVATYEMWRPRGLRALPGVPVTLRDRIRDVQPFTRPAPERPGHPLMLLHALAATRGPRIVIEAGGDADCLPRVTLDTPTGPRTPTELLEQLAVSVAMVLAHVGGETGRHVRSVHTAAG